MEFYIDWRLIKWFCMMVGGGDGGGDELFFHTAVYEGVGVTWCDCGVYIGLGVCTLKRRNIQFVLPNVYNNL